MLEQSDFPDELKHADIKPVCKKDDCTDKTNYRPVSISLPSYLSETNFRQ